MRTLTRSLLVAASIALLGSTLKAQESEVPLKEEEWPHHGVFGTFDRAALQRGFQVYQNVCQSCHGLELLSFRNLGDLGYNEDEVSAIAEQYQVAGTPNESGDVEDRPAAASDKLPPPYPNKQAAAAANGGKAPPDLTLMIKAREGNEDYTYSLLTGYEDPPEGVEVPDGGYYNRYYPGHVIAMPQPLQDDLVSYTDGTAATADQMAKDVTEFLAWTAEPKLEERKQMGLKVVLFLLVMTGLLVAYMRRVWSDVH